MRNDTERALKEFDVKTLGNKKNIEKAEALVGEDESIIFISPTNVIIREVNTKHKEKLPGIAILTDKRFIFSYQLLLQSRVDVIQLDEIRSINCTGNSLTGGHIEIHTITKTYDILVSYKKELMLKIQTAFEDAKNQFTSKESDPAGGSAADEILKFKQLLDAGAITEEEFNAKKKQLLGL